MNYLKNKKIKRGDAGFTLMETLVALFIFSLAIVAMIVVFSSDLRSINYAKKKIVATYLATEGIEYMRSIRDTYGLYDIYQTPATDGWVEFKNKVLNDCRPANRCYIDIDHLDSNPNQSYDLFNNGDPNPITKVLIAPCAILGCPQLYHHISTGRYDYLPAGGNLTDFRRSITVNMLSQDELQIISTVSWEQGSGEKSVTFYDHFFNQIP